jgi:polysaccharide export outer membrane protein
MLNNGRLGQNVLLQHGDVLHVPVAGQQQVFVLGELNRVNTLPMGNIRMSLTEALTKSGGLNQVTSNAEGIFVIRPNAPDAPKLATIYQLDVKNAIAFAVGTQFMLQPSDIVYVTTAPVTRWNRVISQIVPSLNALITADRVGTL